MFTRERSASVTHEDRTARKARFAHSPAVSVGAHKRLGRIRLGRWRSPQSRLARWPSALSLLVGWRSAAPESVGSKSTSSLFDTFALPSNCRHRRIETPRANYAAHAHCNLCLTWAPTRTPKQQPSVAVWAPVMRVVRPIERWVERMTAEVNRLEEQLRRALEGEAWHGPSVLESLAGLSAAQAASHPIAGAHSIWELVLHLAQ